MEGDMTIVTNLIKQLYTSYNGRKVTLTLDTFIPIYRDIKLVTPIEIEFGLLNSEENVFTLLSVVIIEISQLLDVDNIEIQTTESLKKFYEPRGMQLFV